ncbi:MAG TPA: asparagine synthase-related protein [Thermoanaerobaculia bacterium]|nr:asparagine synthase-related protein [Thermoanaerobaculia bacterium]
MTAIAGIYRFDGATVRRDLLERASGLMTHREPSGEHIQISGPLGVIVRGAAPHRSERGDLLLWDGRLDHRNAPQSVSDEELVLRAWMRDGNTAFDSMIGDFTAVLYDAVEKKLVIVRDPFGSRSLLVHVNDRRIVWASTMYALLELAEDVDCEIDENYVAGFLLMSPAADDTPFRDVRHAPAGKVMEVSARGEVSLRTFWQLDPHREVAMSDDEAAARFRELFEEAVAVRMRVPGDVCLELSGGLDSSSIVCVADDLLRRGAVTAKSMTVVSYVFDHSPGADEREYIRMVEEKTGRAAIHLREEDHPILSTLFDMEPPEIPSAEVCFGARRRDLGEVMRKSGARVLMRGLGGDEVLWGDPDRPWDVVDIAHRNELLRLHRKTREWSRLLHDSYFKVLWRLAIRPRLPRAFRPNDGPFQAIPELLNPEFCRPRLAHLERAFYGRKSEGALPSRAHQVAQVMNLVQDFSFGYWIPNGTAQVTNPFTHRPLVEFGVALPLEQKFRVQGGRAVTRFVLRNALKGVLPEGVRTRRTKSGPDEAIYRALRRETPKLQELLRDARVYERGYVKRETLEPALQAARHGRALNTPTLLRILSLEVWLRALERRRTRMAA